MTPEAALQALLAPIVAPVPLIFANQNAPRPAKPYATLDVQDTRPAAWLVEGEPDADGNATFREHALVNVEVQFFGTGAVERARDLGRRLRLPRHANRATALGLGIARVIAARDVPFLLNETQYEARGVLEFTAYHLAELTDDLGRVERVELQRDPGAEPGGASGADDAPGCSHTIEAPAGP